MAFYNIFSNGGFKQGGLNFDAKIRRQSTEPHDLFYAHIGGMDVAARTLLATEKMILDKEFSNYINNRYKDWNNDLGKFIHNKENNLELIAKKVITNNLDPKPRSGNQELLENMLNKYL
jgi:xylose isomerase